MSLFPDTKYRWRPVIHIPDLLLISWICLPVYWLLCCFSLHKARSTVPSYLPLCGWHMPRRRWPSSTQRIPTNVPESPSSRCSSGFDHFWEDGASSRTQLRRNLQKLCLPRDQGFNCKANTGLCLAYTQARARAFTKN